MRKVWISWALFVSLAGGLLALPGMAEAQQSAAGKWTGTARGMAGSRQFSEAFTMVLNQNGQKVTGTYSGKIEIGAPKQSGRERTGVPVTGTLTGDKLSLQIGKLETLEATVDGDSMTGSAVRGKSPPRHVSATRAR